MKKSSPQDRTARPARPNRPARRTPAADRNLAAEWQKEMAINFLSQVDLFCLETVVEGESADIGVHSLSRTVRQNWDEISDYTRESFEWELANDAALGNPASVKFMVDLIAEFDLREPIAPQLSEWLQRMAERLQKAAGDLAGYPEDRDFNAIRKLCNGKLTANLESYQELTLRPVGHTTDSDRPAVTITHGSLCEVR